MDSYTFAVTEVFRDGRILVCTYVRIGEQITCIMDVYDDHSMTTGKRYLDLHVQNGKQILPALPTMRQEG